MFDPHPEMQIKFARRDRAFMLVFLNLILTVSLMAHLHAIAPQYHFNLSEISFEIASFVSVLIMFIAATLIKVTLAERRMVLIGLFALQTGNLLDAANDIFYSTQTHWWLIGDGLTFLGEIILALVVFQFVRLTNNLTNRDPLTGLYNRSFHMRAMAELLKTCHSKKEPLTVIAVDIDHFKHVNDVYGHAFGDLALQTLAKKVLSFDQQARLISRTGGEEFEIVADGLDELAAVSLAEKIRNAIAEIDLGEDRRLTASLGVSLSHVGEALASLRQRADGAAYKAKNTGRNRVCVAD